MASDCLYCIPAVDIQPDSPTHVGTRIRQVIPEKKRVTQRSFETFDVPLSLGNVGANTIAVNINLFDQTTGLLIIMAMALDIEVQAPANLSPPAIIGISAASVAFVALLLVLIFVLFRYKKVVRKVVRNWSPRSTRRTYPSQLVLFVTVRQWAPTVNDLNVLEAIATNMGTVHSKDFMALDKLGMGEFGDVFKGACFTGGSAALCAIKSLKEDHRELLADSIPQQMTTFKSGRGMDKYTNRQHHHR